MRLLHVAALLAGAQAWLAAPCAPMVLPRAAPRAPACAMVDPFVIERLRAMRRVHDDLSAQLEDPSVQANIDEMLRVTRERAKLDAVVEALGTFETCELQLGEAKELFNEDDAEIREMARGEIKEIEATMEELDATMKVLLLPSDPNDEKNVMFEIRAGTGGDEAAIWAADLLNLYTRYAQTQVCGYIKFLRSVHLRIVTRDA